MGVPVARLLLAGWAERAGSLGSKSLYPLLSRGDGTAVTVLRNLIDSVAAKVL